MSNLAHKENYKEEILNEIYDDYELENLKEEEKKCIGNAIKSSILKGLETTIEEVFKNVIKEQ